MVPALAGGKTLINAAVSSEQNALTNWWLRRFVFVFRLWRFWRRHRARLNGKRVTIGVDLFRKIFPEIFSAIVGNEQCESEKVNALIVCRIDADLTEIKWARVDRAHAHPFFAAVFRAEHAAAFAAQVGQLARAA